MKIAITGASGLLGSELLALTKKIGISAVALERSNIKLGCGLDNAVEQIKQVNCDVLIHCAANTNVDFCEIHPETCYKDNVLFTELLANVCRKLEICLVFISSTGVYGSHKTEPYFEYDNVLPTTHHHRSKWLAEKALAQLHQNSLIIRTGWLFGGGYQLPKNFVANRIKEAIASDGTIKSDPMQIGNPTYSGDVAKTIIALLEGGWRGTFNCVNKGRASRFEYVSEVIRLSGINILVEPIAGAAFNRKAKVSHNESAINFKLSQFGLDAMPSWKDSLASYISTIRSEYERT